MINGDTPSARQGRSSFGLGAMQRSLSRSTVRLPQRNQMTHAADTACERMVASAAPFTPISKVNMNRGSRPILSTAPMSTVSILVREKPCAVMKAFMPSAACTNTVPMA